MNGRGLIVAVIGVGVSLGALMVGLHRTTAHAIADNRSAINDVRDDVSDLRERMARLEGRVDTLVDLFTAKEAE